MEQTTLRKSRCEFRGIPFKFAAMSLGIIDAGMVAKAAQRDLVSYEYVYKEVLNLNLAPRLVSKVRSNCYLEKSIVMVKLSKQKLN